MRNCALNMKCTEIALEVLLYWKGNSLCALPAVGLFSTLGAAGCVCVVRVYLTRRKHCISCWESYWAHATHMQQACLCVALIHRTVCSYFFLFHFLFVCFCSRVFHCNDYTFKSGLILEALFLISPVTGCEKNLVINWENVIWNSSRGNKHKFDNIIKCASAIDIIFWL